MVRRLVALLSKNIDGLHEAAFVLAFFAVLSQLLGLFRDRLLAHLFGAGSTLDVYYAAFRIPDLIFVSIASTVSLFIVIPLLAARAEEGDAAGRKFMENLVGVFSVVIIAVSVIAFIATPRALFFLFPVLADGPFGADLIAMTRILLLSPILLGLSNLLASITQLERCFFVYALSPTLYNIGIIAGVLFLFPFFGLPGLAWGVVIGTLLHLLVQLPALVRSPLSPRLPRPIAWRDFWNVIRISLPRTLTLASGQFAILVLVVLAGRLFEGSVTIFNFAFNLQSAPLAIIGVSYSVAAFPTLARFFSRGEHDAFAHHIIIAVRHILFWSFPALILFIVLRAQIVRTILGSGAFSWSDTRLTAAALALFVVSLAAQGLVMLFVRGYYAAGKTLKPLAAGAISVGITVASALVGLTLFRESTLFRYFLEALLRVEDISGTEVLVLAGAYSLGSIVNALLLWWMFERDFQANPLTVSAGTLWQSFSASVITGAAAYVSLGVFDGIFDITTLVGIFLQGLSAGAVGILVGIGVLLLLKSEELGGIATSLRHRFWKAQPIIPEQQEL